MQASGEINTNEKAIYDEVPVKEADKNDISDLPDLKGKPVAGSTGPVRHTTHRAYKFIDTLINIMGDDNCDNNVIVNCTYEILS